MRLLIDLAIIVLLLCGIRLFRRPLEARKGNLTAATALALAFLLVLYRHDIIDPAIVIIALLVGSAIGWATAMRVNMIQIPAMIAFQHGMGGIAAFLVSFEELVQAQGVAELVGPISGAVSLIIGAFTFGGSMIASAKLAARINQRPTVFGHHSLILSVLALAGVILAIAALQAGATQRVGLLVVLIALSITVGVLFSIRIGGADMPVLISFLNATAGLAAAFCGIIIQNRLLIACGATVAASGSILTHVMCKAMNRGLINIFVGTKASSPSGVPQPQAHRPDEPQPVAEENPKATLTSASKHPSPLSSAAEALRGAASVVIVPGYGMALAQAQFDTVRLAGLLERQGRRVRFAIHPVAGRMPGHMNVLLAEADVDYGKLMEMDDVNPQMKDTDVVLVVGACDVVNPAAIEQEGTPISGMPILAAHEAHRVIVCNLDEKPGYSGVQNPLYTMERTTMILGDAKKSLEALVNLVGDAEATGPSDQERPDPLLNAAQALRGAASVVIVPGYGMALAQAQFDTVRLAGLLERQGRRVLFAIHPVAGRMPGHMNVLLAEADVDYDKLMEMDDVNPQMKDTDVVLVIGACDVVNPAAIEQEGTPISGMPILAAHEAHRVIVCNLDERPGYSGLRNPLYTMEPRNA